MNKSRENDYASQSRVIPFNMLFVEGIPNPIAKTLSKIMLIFCQGGKHNVVRDHVRFSSSVLMDLTSYLAHLFIIIITLFLQP